jgi:hypothetical protein
MMRVMEGRFKVVVTTDDDMKGEGVCCSSESQHNYCRKNDGRELDSNT